MSILRYQRPLFIFAALLGGSLVSHAQTDTPPVIITSDPATDTPPIDVSPVDKPPIDTPPTALPPTELPPTKLPPTDAPTPVDIPTSTPPIFAGGVTPANQKSGSSLARFASGTGNVLFLGLGTLLPLVEDGKDGKNHSLRTADSLLTSTLITEVLKEVTHEKRPDGSDFKSFPSGHATAAFAVAAMQSHYHPTQAPLWYAGAALISYSRVNLNRHYYKDIIAGAAVGYFTARWELSQPRGLILAPFLGSRQKGGSKGMSLTFNF